jgi:hypothetical protein
LTTIYKTYSIKGGAQKKLSMYVITNTKTVKGKTYRSHLLCHSYRKDGKVKRKVLANLSHLPDELINIIRHGLKGEIHVGPSAKEKAKVFNTKGHGQVMVVLRAMTNLRLPQLICRNSCRERNLVLAMIASRIIEPQSKLSTTHWWTTNTMADELGLVGADEDDLYKAMDWLYSRQASIEKALALRHLNEGDLALYDLSSSYLKGEKCNLGKYGYSRDKKRGKTQINYGLLTDRIGRPVGIEVYPGNISDATTFCPMVERIRKEYKLEKIVLVGDRGMLGTKNIEILRCIDGIDWISALKSVSIKTLANKNNKIKPSLFDEKNILEIHAPDDYPGERLIFCRNPALAERRKKTRIELLESTEKLLDKIKIRVEAGRLKGEGPINMVIGRIIDKFHMKKHFILDITDNSFIINVI